MDFKGLSIGLAGVLATGFAAEAADLPIAEPVEYVRVCDAFGEGFYYIPGTETCLRVGGRMRVDAFYVDTTTGEADEGIEFFEIDQGTNNFSTQARGYVRLDARTTTDLALIRAYISIRMHVGRTGPGQITNYDDTETELEQAFIEISTESGSFVVGQTASFFDFWGSNTYGVRVAIDDNTAEQNVFAYTRAFGNGFSATLSLEDPASGFRRLDPGGNIRNYEGQEWPDLIANVRVDRTWGSAQIMGLVRHIHDKENIIPVGSFTEGSDDDDKFGWAIGAGASIHPPDSRFGFDFQAGYADGALAYITRDLGNAADFDGDNFVPGEPVPQEETTQAWSVRGGVTAKVSESVEAHFDASYTDVNSERDVRDYVLWAAAANVVWSPAPGLSMGPEIAYNSGEFDDSDSDDQYGAMFRIQRDF